MTSEAINSAIELIREYTHMPEHELLANGTLFSYDVFLPGSKSAFDVAVFGINEKEYPADQCIRKMEAKILEDTSLHNFRAADDGDDEAWKSAKGLTRKMACQWYRIVRSFIGDEVSAVLGEFFFWSSVNATADFVRRYGTSFLKSPHLEFCRDRNCTLLQQYEPRLVVVSGSEASRCELLADRSLYNLRADNDQSPLQLGKYPARFYREKKAGRLWMFAAHFSNGHGISADDKARFRDRVAHELNRG